MKHLKKLYYLILMSVIIVSCEKEQITVMDNAEIDNNEIKLLQREEVSLLQFSYDSEEFDCTTLPTQNFDYSNYSDAFSGPIDEYTNTIHISPGDILPGISFDFTNGLFSDGFWIPSNSYGYPSILMTKYSEGKIIINFTDSNVDVKDVSMRLFDSGNSNFYVHVYGDEDNILGSELVPYAWPFDRAEGVFLGIHSEVSIAKIEISSSNGYEGVDMISFGNCNNPDLDGDGILNEDDAHPNSNMSEEISFGGFYPGVANSVLSNGSTMADEVDDLIAEIWAKINSGDMSRYYNPQLDFQRQMTYVLAKWYRTDRVITDREKTKIVRSVRSSRIFEDESR